MRNENVMLGYALRILETRAKHWEKKIAGPNKSMAAAFSIAYGSAAQILRYALENDYESLRQYDYYEEDK